MSSMSLRVSEDLIVSRMRKYLAAKKAANSLQKERIFKILHKWLSYIRYYHQPQSLRYKMYKIYTK